MDGPSNASNGACNRDSTGILANCTRLFKLVICCLQCLLVEPAEEQHACLKASYSSQAQLSSALPQAKQRLLCEASGVTFSETRIVYRHDLMQPAPAAHFHDTVSASDEMNAKLSSPFWARPSEHNYQVSFADHVSVQDSSPVRTSSGNTGSLMAFERQSIVLAAGGLLVTGALWYTLCLRYVLKPVKYVLVLAHAEGMHLTHNTYLFCCRRRAAYLQSDCIDQSTLSPPELPADGACCAAGECELCKLPHSVTRNSS